MSHNKLKFSSLALMLLIVSVHTASISFDGPYYSAFDCVSLSSQDGWTINPPSTSIQCGDQFLSGVYAQNGYVQAAFDSLVSHASITLTLYFAALDTWNSQGFYIMADSQVIFQKNFTTNVSPSPFEWSNTCNKAGNDYFEKIEVSFSHNSSTLQLFLSSNYLGSSSTGGWAFCGLEIYLNSCDKDLYYNNPSSCLSSCPLGMYADPKTHTCTDCQGPECLQHVTSAFSCYNLQKDTQWRYTPQFRSNTCGDNSFTGGYGKGAHLDGYYYIPYSYKSLIIEFHAFFIGAWNFDELRLFVNDKIVFRTQYAAQQQNNYEACGATGVTRRFKVAINHNSSLLKLKFLSTLSVDASSASWGICGLNITTRDCSIDRLGYCQVDLVAPYRLYQAFKCQKIVDEEAWEYPDDLTNPQCRDMALLGGFSPNVSDAPELNGTFIDLPAHQSVYLNYEFVAINGLDNQQLAVFADGASLNLSLLNSLAEVPENMNKGWLHECQNDTLDFVTRVITSFPHTSTQLQINFNSSLLGDTNQTWGLCDLQLFFNPCPIGKVWFTLNNSCLDNCPKDHFVNITVGVCQYCTRQTCLNQSLKLFDSSKLKIEDNWDYQPGYRTSNCGNSTVVGMYSEGAYIEGRYMITRPYKSMQISFNITTNSSGEGAFYVFVDDEVKMNLPILSTGSQCSAPSPYSVSFNNEKDTVNVAFHGSNLTWGISDVVLTLRDCRVKDNGECRAGIIIENTTEYTAFSSSNVIEDDVWEYPKGFASYSCLGVSYVGPFVEKELLSASFTQVPPHGSIYVTFTVHLVGHWFDDRLYIQIQDGQQIRTLRYDYNEDPEGWNMICSSLDGTVCLAETHVIGFTHTSENLTIAFYSEAIGGKKASWGMNNLSIFWSICPYDQFALENECVTECPEGYLPNRPTMSCVFVAYSVEL